MHQESNGSCGIYEIYNYGLLLFYYRYALSNAAPILPCTSYIVLLPTYYLHDICHYLKQSPLFYLHLQIYYVSSLECKLLKNRDLLALFTAIIVLWHAADAKHHMLLNMLFPHLQNGDHDGDKSTPVAVRN